MAYSTDTEKYELNGPGTSSYGATWDEEPDTQAFMGKEQVILKKMERSDKTSVPMNASHRKHFKDSKIQFESSKQNGGQFQSSFRDGIELQKNSRHQHHHQGYEESDEECGGGATSASSGTPYESRGLYFRDGRRKIDFILVYEEPKPQSGDGGKRSFMDLPQQRVILDSGTRDRHERWRTKFMGNLRKIGLDMEEEVVDSDLSTTHYIKLCTPWSVLVHYAEELNLRAPLQAYPMSDVVWSDNISRALKIPNIMRQDVPCKPLHFFTCPFKKSKIDKFLGSDNHDVYFTNTQRSRVVYEILQTSAYGKRRHAEIGIDRLVEEGAYSAAFPLHEGPYKSSATKRGRKVEQRWTRRQILYSFWAKWGRWYKYQPLDHVREYFGEKIAYYFAWLGFYTGWLIPASVVGVLVFLYGTLAMFNNPVAQEICESGEKYKMCPLCDEEHGCTYWYLSDMCSLNWLAYLFDHPGTVFYAVFVSFWSVLFLEYWKRHSASLAHYWDCMDLDQEELKPRPQFAARASHMERNPVTGIREPAFPKSTHTKRIVIGMGIICVMVALVFIFIVAIIVYRIIVSIPLFQNPDTRPHASDVASLTGAIVQLIIIVILGNIYAKIAERITEWEMHRTAQEFEDHLTCKVFVFQFVNFYSAIFYIAFVKGKFTGYPGHYNQILGLRPEDCSAGGCLVELAQQLAVIMIGKQIINNTVEIAIPKIKSFFHRRRLRRSHLMVKSRWEGDYELIPYEGLFSEYLEMIIQYGFITIFVAAFPLAPLFALLNNWVELRLDAQKLICETRRVIALRAQNIGIWFTILESITQLAVITNAFLIAFTSDFLPRLVYRYTYDRNLEGYVNFTLAYAPNGTLSQECRYSDFRDKQGNYTNFHWTLLAVRLAFIIIFEHIVFGISHLIEVIVPDVPESLDIKIRRERYLAKQALTDADNIIKIKQQIEEDDYKAENEP